MRRSFYTEQFIAEHTVVVEKCPTFEEDFEMLRTVLAALHANDKDVSFMTTKLSEYSGSFYTVYELTRIASRSVFGKGSDTGLRITYVFDEKTKKITFCELYSKYKEFNHDRIVDVIRELDVNYDKI